MKSIVIYEAATGIIVKCVTCPDSMIDIQCGNGEAYIEHDRVDDADYKVDLDTLTIVPFSVGG